MKEVSAVPSAMPYRPVWKTEDTATKSSILMQTDLIR